MATLYEINSEIEEAIERATAEAIESDGIISDLTASELDKLEIDRNIKIDNTALFIKNLTAEIAMIKAEEKNLKERRQAVERKVENVKQWLQFNLHGETRTEGNYKLSYRKSKAVEISGEVESLPVEYINQKISYTADKTAIKKAILGGVEINGASVIEKINMVVK